MGERLKSLRVADRYSARQYLHRDGRGSGRTPVPDAGTEHPSGDDVRLPVRLTLQPCDRVIDGQQLERPNPGILSCIVRDERSDEACLQGDLAARKALVAASLKPRIGVVALVWAGAAEAIFQHLRTDSGDYR